MQQRRGVPTVVRPLFNDGYMVHRLCLHSCDLVRLGMFHRGSTRELIVDSDKKN